MPYDQKITHEFARKIRYFYKYYRITNQKQTLELK